MITMTAITGTSGRRGIRNPNVPLGSTWLRGLFPTYRYRLTSLARSPIGSGSRKRPNSGEYQRRRSLYRPLHSYTQLYPNARICISRPVNPSVLPTLLSEIGVPDALRIVVLPNGV